MSSAPSAQEIVRDAGWLAQALDPGTGLARFVEMTPEAYRAASFLDDRMLQGPVNAHTLPFTEIAGALPGDARRDARWIFHIGHVGSTLVARLLGELDGVLSIREPRILRDVAGMPGEQRGPIVPAVQKLLSRTFAADETALVKATSFVSEIAPELVPPGERALFMYATPRNYIASILAGENSGRELRALAPSRTQRLARRVSALWAAHSDAELAAVAWACEMTALEAAADAMADRPIDWADFDRMLDNMPVELSRVAKFFGFEAAPGQLAALATGPLMSRYSKALEYEYSAGLRRDLIAEAAAAHGGAIDGALAMLRSAAEKSPMLARSLARAGEA